MKKTFITLLALAGIAMGETLTLTIPTGIQNHTGTKDVDDNGDGIIDREDVVYFLGYGSTGVDAAITKSEFANGNDGGYMFNKGGQVNPDASIKEGEIISADGVTSLTLAPRKGAGGSGEAIVLSGSNLVGYSVDSFTFEIAESTCTTTANIALTLAVIQKGDNNAWSLVEKTTGSLTLNSGAELTLTLSNSIDWTNSYKVVAIIDNTAQTLAGGNSPTYTMTGISVTATGTPVVPEPATATLSLLALAGLAARRRRK